MFIMGYFESKKEKYFNYVFYFGKSKYFSWHSMFSKQAEIRSFELHKSYTTTQKSYCKGFKHTVKLNLFVGFFLVPMINNTH